ncbi:hypothetical protein [Paracoccus tibetensis]|uniref:hypothetical protein n=1 Tax=Paracoccus tibetensis TaxID=336292 RepID=UPI001113316C|nr:hypothetical protein [Paracoccus tibetensis]
MPARLALDPLPLGLGCAQKLNAVHPNGAKSLGAADAVHGSAIYGQIILPGIKGHLGCMAAAVAGECEADGNAFIRTKAGL